jgi:hypothetical protein
MAEGLILENETVKKRPSGRKRERLILPKAVPPAVPAKAQFDDEFDEEEYLRQHPEVADAIGDGHLPNALFHFRLFGTAPRATAETIGATSLIVARRRRDAIRSRDHAANGGIGTGSDRVEAGVG